jgi:hypothetical protein
MKEQSSTFICCTRKQIAVFRCPRCQHLLGYCQSCSTLFHNLKDTSASMTLPNGALDCANCQYSFPAGEAKQKHLATARDLVEAGLSALTSENLLLNALPKTETDSENYRQTIDHIGWDGKISAPAPPRTKSNPNLLAPPNSGTHPLVRALALIILLACLGGGYYFIKEVFFPTFPQTKPPAKALKPVKPAPAKPPGAPK